MSNETFVTRLMAALRRFGLVVAIVACAAVLWRLARFGGDPLLPLSRPQSLLIVAGLSAAYSCALFLQGLTWAMLAAPVSSGQIPALVRAYGVSSIAKYLPGNVFHFAGRHLEASETGVSHRAMFTATLVEAGLSVVAAVIVASVLFLVAGDTGMAGLETGHARTAVGVALVLGVAALLVVAGTASSGGVLARRLQMPGAGAVLSGTCLLMAFFCLSGLVAAGLSQWVVGATASLAAIASAAIFSWIAGFVTPGASGGIGVREAALVLALRPVIGEVDALSFAVMLRVITTVGDFLFLGANYFMLRRPVAAAGDHISEAEP